MEMDGKGKWTRWGLVALAVAVSGGPAVGQSARPRSSSVPVSGPVGATSPDRIVREIRDPHTGQHWMLLANPANPAGPGRLVAADEGQRWPAARTGSSPPAIRPGDPVVVEEHTSAVEAYLGAVALEPARIGTQLHVR